MGWLSKRREARAQEERAASVASIDEAIARAEAGIPAARRDDRIEVVISIVAMVLGAGFVVAGVMAGFDVEWNFEEWVSRGRVGGPLWFFLLMSLFCGVILGGPSIHRLLHPTSRRRRAEELLASYRRERAELEAGRATAASGGDGTGREANPRSRPLS